MFDQIIPTCSSMNTYKLHADGQNPDPLMKLKEKKASSQEIT
jgi:hypothetical protein